MTLLKESMEVILVVSLARLVHPEYTSPYALGYIFGFSCSSFSWSAFFISLRYALCSSRS
jgi:hypothetical protein